MGKRPSGLAGVALLTVSVALFVGLFVGCDESASSGRPSPGTRVSDDCGGVVDASREIVTLTRITAMYRACNSPDAPIAYVRGKVTVMAKAGNRAVLVIGNDSDGLVVTGWITP